MTAIWKPYPDYFIAPHYWPASAALRFRWQLHKNEVCGKCCRSRYREKGQL